MKILKIINNIEKAKFLQLDNNLIHSLELFFIFSISKFFNNFRIIKKFSTFLFIDKNKARSKAMKFRSL